MGIVEPFFRLIRKQAEWFVVTSDARSEVQYSAHNATHTQARPSEARILMPMAGCGRHSAGMSRDSELRQLPRAASMEP